MVSPTRRREAVAQLETGFAVSERRACRVVGQPRSTQRYGAKRRRNEPEVVRRMHELVRAHPRYGYRRIWALLRSDGWRVNRKRIWRLWRKEGFKVPQRQRKKRRLGQSENGIVRFRPQHPDHVWTWDFIHDRDAHGRPLKWLGLVDEYTRECLALEVERSLTAWDVVDVIRQVVWGRRAPQHLRSDNGPEFIAQVLRTWLASAEIGTLYIAPASPWENGYAESFFSRLRDELLNAEVFADLREAQALAAGWRNEYNQRRPHSSLGYLTPAAYAAQRRQQDGREGGDGSRRGGAGSAPLGALAPLRPPLRGEEADEYGQTLITTGT